MLISVSYNSEAWNRLWASSKFRLSLFSYLNVLSTSVFLLFVHLVFVFVLFSFLIFFWKDVFKVGFFHFPLSFFQFRVNEKTVARKNWLCIRALQQMHISKSDRGRR